MKWAALRSTALVLGVVVMALGNGVGCRAHPSASQEVSLVRACESRLGPPVSYVC